MNNQTIYWVVLKESPSELVSSYSTINTTFYGYARKIAKSSIYFELAETQEIVIIPDEDIKYMAPKKFTKVN